MKKKFIAVLLCIVLLLTLSVNTLADTSTITPDTINTCASSAVSEITVTTDQNGNALIAEPLITIDPNIAVATAATPIGYLDFVTSTEISGWAYQSDIPNSWLEVHIYIADKDGNTVDVIATRADMYRSDLASAGFGNGYHGFCHNMDWMAYVPGTYTVSAYAIGINSSNVQLTLSPQNFTVRNVQSGIDIITSTYIQGWIWKPDAPNEALDVHAYVYRSNGDLYGVYTDTADIYRNDLYNAGIGNGYHGFIIDVNFNSLLDERLTVEFHYIDGSGYHPIFYVGFYNSPTHSSITLYGIIHDNKDIRRSYYTDNARIAIENMGFSTINGPYTGTTASSALNRMINSNIWIVHTHGLQSSVLFNSSTNGETTLTYSQIAALPYGALENELCVIYGTCYGGQGRENAQNMVNITKEKGAATVIGWEDETCVNQMNVWLEAFLVSSGQGNTISGAIDDALLQVRETYQNNLGGLDEIYYVGASAYKLIY
ncbi:MAG: hypothetical protein IJN65_01310 [Clostridia bacterium]|nr:hypothetical protein [Clostridia bacterium]